MVVGCSSRFTLDGGIRVVDRGEERGSSSPMTPGEGSSRLAHSIKNGQARRVKRGVRGQTENIAGGLFAVTADAMKPGRSSDGMEPLSTSTIASGLKQALAKRGVIGGGARKD